MYINWSLNSGYISKFPCSYITRTHGIIVGATLHIAKLFGYLRIKELKDQLH